MIIFDITKKETFVNLSKWIQTVQMRASIEHPPIIVLGNKADIDHKIEVDNDNIEEFRSSHPTIPVFEVSARSGLNVNDAFTELCIKMVDIKKSFSGIKLKSNRASRQVEEIGSTNDSTNLNKTKQRLKSRCCK